MRNLADSSRFNGRLRKRLLPMNLFFLAPFAVSCASYTSHPPTLLRVQYAAVSEEKQGLAMGVTPYLDVNKSKEIFDADVKQVGILPLQLVVRNKHQKRITIRKNDFILKLSGGEEYAPAPTDSVVARLESHAGVIGWTVAFGFYGYIASSAQKDKGDKLRRADFRKKQFTDTNLGFQESARGFLFYFVPDDMKEIKGAKLLGRAVDESTGERIEMTLSLPDMGEFNVLSESDNR